MPKYTGHRTDFLSPEQEESLQNLIQYSENLLTSTALTDRNKVEEGILELYKNASSKQVPKVVWFDGPKEASKVAAAVFGSPSRHLLEKHSRGVDPWDALSNPLWARVNQLLNKQNIMGRLATALPEVDDGRTRLLQTFGVPAQHLTLLSKWIQTDLLQKECKDSWLKLVGAGWSAFFPNCVIITERPSVLEFDQSGLTHCETGPAIVGRDGTQFWRWRGVPTTEKVVLSPETLTVAEIHAERNQDHRSVMVERMGWPKYLRESKSKLRNKRKNEIDNQLEALYETPFNECRLVVSCPTLRMFTLAVPPQIQNCEQAQAWLRGSITVNLRSDSIEETGRKLNMIART